MRYRSFIRTGRGEGKKIGSPTLNFSIPPHVTEAYGIYAGYVWLNGEKKKAAFHWGPIPAYQILEPSLEAHLLDEDISSPPSEAEFELSVFLREVMFFPSKEKLADQIERDVNKAREVLS